MNVLSGIVPVASFTLTPSIGDIPLSVAFTNTTTEDPTFNPYSWAWNFGDTNTSTSKNPSPNTYSTKGTYTVSLTATNVAGSSSPATTTVTAYDPADRLDYSPSTQLMNWSTETGGLNFTNPNVTLADFKSIVDPSNIKAIKIDSTVNPITTISNTNYYTSLNYLGIENQALTSISGIGVTGLKYLSLRNNVLSSVTITDLPNLTFLDVDGNALSGTLNLSSRTPLTLLSVADNAISELNVTGNTSMNTLYTYLCPNLTKITGLASCTALNILQVWNCDLRGTGPTPFDVSTLTNLIVLQTSGNANLSVLDVTNNTKLTALYCQDDGLSSINLSNNTELQYLAVNGNSLTSLDLSNNTKLTFLYMYANTSVGIPTGFSSLTKLKDLAMSQCGITVPIDCTPFVDLETFSCGDTDTTIPSVNLSTCTKLKSVVITKCSLITTFNLPSSVPQLKTLYGYECALTVSEVNSILTKLDANGITGGDVKLWGGTNAAPTGAGITAKNNLLAKGWTVTTN
jgi:PKD repeat protein